METRGAHARGLCGLDKTGAGLIQGGVYTELEVNEARGGLIIYHGVMLKVELESGGLHSVLIEGLRRKCTESRSLFSGKKRVTRSLDWRPMV